MRVGLVSDLHEHFPDLNHMNLDGLIIAGDISFKPYMDVRLEREMWNNKFVPWLGKQNIDYINVMPGNHDWFPYLMPHLAQEMCNSVSHMTKRVTFHNYGRAGNFYRDIGYIPFSLAFCDWAYQATEIQMKNLLAQLGYVNVLVSHGPVYGYGDTDKNGSHGSIQLLKYIEDVHPNFIFCGHIHSGRGIYKHNYTTIVNCAMTDDFYRPLKKLYVWCTDTDVITEEEL